MKKKRIPREDRVFPAMVNYLLIRTLNLDARQEKGAAGNQALTGAFFDITSRLEPTVFCDIGAFDGGIAAQFKQRNPDCRVYAFEANPQVHARFNDLHQESGVDYRNLAIDQHSGNVTIYAPQTTSREYARGRVVEISHREQSRTRRASPILRDDEAATYTEFEVTAYSLDNFLANEGLDLADENVVLWIDVEGASHRVLRGARQTLKSTAAVFVETETHRVWKGQQDSTQIAEFLIRRNLAPVARDRQFGDHQFNTLFVHADRLAVVERDLFVRGSPVRACLSAPADPQPDRKHRSVEAAQPPAPADVDQSAVPRIPAPPGNALAVHLQRDIPIFIPAYNNPTYVRNMVDQLRARQLDNIVVVDNASTSDEMHALLSSDFGAKVVRNQHNRGPRHVILDDDIFALLPRIFCVTDPDLELNPDLPPNFLAILASLTERFQVGKAGFSLDISQPEAMRDEIFQRGKTSFKIWDWERRFWADPIAELDGLGTIYRAPIVTTFAVYNKQYIDQENPFAAIRVAGVFTCRHLPWYRDTGLPAAEEETYRSTQNMSTYLKS